MQRIDASKLLQILNKTSQQKICHVIVSDIPIFKKLVEEKIKQETSFIAREFSDKNGVENFVNYLSTCGMFEPAQPCIIHLPAKPTQKNWQECKKYLQNIPTPLEANAYFFAPLLLKNTLKQDDFPAGANLYLTYEPNDLDLSKCAVTLLLRYPSLAKKSKPEQLELCQLTLESYSNDLFSCDMHFARMENGKLSFQEALVGSPEVNAFHVVDALALKDKQLIELRLCQCADSGEEASSILMAISYFLKQTCFVLAELEQIKNLKLAFDNAKIPYPAQARLQKGLSFLNKEKIFTFFAKAAKMEMEMRLQKNPHQYLSIELINWLQ